MCTQFHTTLSVLHSLLANTTSFFYFISQCQLLPGVFQSDKCCFLVGGIFFSKIPHSDGVFNLMLTESFSVVLWIPRVKQIGVCFHQSQLQRAMWLWRIFHHMTSSHTPTHILSDFWSAWFQEKKMNWWKEKKQAAAEWMTWTSRTGRQLSNAWWRSQTVAQKNLLLFAFSVSLCWQDLTFPPHVNWVGYKSCSDLQSLYFLLVSCVWQSDRVPNFQIRESSDCLFMLQIWVFCLCFLFFVNVQNFILHRIWGLWWIHCVIFVLICVHNCMLSVTKNAVFLHFPGKQPCCHDGKYKTFRMSIVTQSPETCMKGKTR